MTKAALSVMPLVRQRRTSLSVTTPSGHASMYHNLVNLLVTWMRSHDTVPLLAHLIEDYLRV